MCQVEIYLASLSLLENPWSRFPWPFSLMYSEIKILQLFSKGKGGNVFVNSKSTSHWNCWLSHTDMSTSGIKFTFFWLRFYTEVWGGVTTVVLTWQLAETFLRFEDDASHLFLKRICTALTCQHMTSGSRVSPVWVTTSLTCEPEQFPRLEHCWGHLRCHWEKSSSLSCRNRGSSNSKYVDEAVLSYHHLHPPFGWGR